MVYGMKKNNNDGSWAAFVAFAVLILLTFVVGQCNGQSLSTPKPQRDCVCETYRAELGVREATGNNDGYHVEKYLASTQLGPGYAWCAAFVNWSVRKCGVIGPQAAAWSPSWFPAERLNHGPPKPGDVFGIYFPSKNRIAHVGFIDEVKENHYVTLEGNTNDVGSREGDGVYRKYRIKKQVSATANWID